MSDADKRIAADLLFKRLLIKPDDLDAGFRYAELETELGDYEAAIGALERMLYYNPNLPRVKLQLGVLYFHLRSYEMARTYFELGSRRTGSARRHSHGSADLSRRS